MSRRGNDDRSRTHLRQGRSQLVEIWLPNCAADHDSWETEAGQLRLERRESRAGRTGRARRMAD